MLTAEQNERVTRTGPGTPAGRLLRRYWQPICLSTDLVPDTPLPITIMGEDLVLFRDEQNRVGILGRHCPHRGADLSYGRLEDGGLRCVYHGWLFDVTGQCREQPAEPADRQWCDKVQHKAYPCHEIGGLIFAYMGEGEAPVLPALECLTVPDSHRFTWRFRERCNWLQALEGDIDPFHLSFLHRAMKPRPQAAGGSGERYYQFYAKGKPRLEVERTAFGVRIYTIRELGEEAYLRVTNFVMPNAAAVAGPTGDAGYTMMWHVPIDDHSHYKYMLNFQRSGPLDHAVYQTAYEGHVIPGSRELATHRTRENRYLQDRASMAEWYAGIGDNFQTHDTFVTESMGPVYDRSQERLGYSDRAIILARKLLLEAVEAIEAGADPGYRIPPEADPSLPDLVVRSVLAPDKDHFRDAMNLPRAAE